MTGAADSAPDRALIRRILAAEAAYSASRMGVLQRLPGNPLAIELRRVGEAGAAALMARNVAMNPYFNRVVGIADEETDAVPELIDWYRSAGVPPQFELAPGIAGPALFAALARAGLAQTGFQTTLIGAPDAHPGSRPGIEVERVATPAQLELFLDAYAAGREVPDREGFKANVRGWLGEPGWSLYLARCDGAPAGGAVLHLHDRLGYLADAAVDPAFRRKGAHRALIARRGADAAAAGAERVWTQAAFLSQSWRNMLASGFAVLFTQAIWTVPG